MSNPLITTTRHPNSTTMAVRDNYGANELVVEWMSDMQVFITVNDGDGNTASVSMHKSLAKEFFRLLAGQQKTRVGCDIRGCVHNELGICTLDEISISENSGCEHTYKELTTINE